MTHGYHNIFGEERDYNVLTRSGMTHLEAVANDWVFGSSAPVVPPSGAGWWKSRKKRLWDEDEEELFLL